MNNSEISSIKEELIEQINNKFPEDKKDVLKILSMNDSEFIEFLKTNNLIKNSENCVLCSIISGEIPATKITENEKALAILEINPISEGHVIIIPKEHTIKKEEIDQDIEKLIYSVKQKLEESLRPKKVEIFYSEAFNHQIINLLPVYSDETQNSKRNKSTLEDLEIIKEKLFKEKEEDKINEIKSQPEREILDSSKTKIPKRIP